MKTENAARIRRASALFLALAVLCFGRPAAAEPAAPAPAPTGAKAILKSMSDWLGRAEVARADLRQRHRDHHARAGEDPVHQLRLDGPGPPRQVPGAPCRRLRGRRARLRRKGRRPCSGKTSTPTPSSSCRAPSTQMIAAMRAGQRRRDAGRGLPGFPPVRPARRRRARGQAHRPGRRRRGRMRAPRLPQRRDRLAALGRGRPETDAAQDRHHEQDARRGAAVHGANQELEDRRRLRRPARSPSCRRPERGSFRPTPSSTSTSCRWVAPIGGAK